MRIYTPIILSFSLILSLFGVSYYIKNSSKAIEKIDIGSFSKTKSCVKYPDFLKSVGVSALIAIDLSQQRFKGLAFRFGKALKKALHLKSWERFEYFGDYALDRAGNIYLTPMPFISIKPITFNLQKNIYKLDSKSGKLSIWKTIEEVTPSSTNPFGIVAIEYDCETDSLFVSAIDKSNYSTSRGRIYHIDIKSKDILEVLEGVDALSLKILKTDRGKYLLAGLAKDSSLIAYKIENNKLISKKIFLFKIPNELEHIRKIRVVGDNLLEVKTIPFLYNLIAQTTQGSIRTKYILKYMPETLYWNIK